MTLFRNVENVFYITFFLYDFLEFFYGIFRVKGVLLKRTQGFSAKQICLKKFKLFFS